MTAAPLASKLDALLAARVVPVLRYQDAATAAYAAEVAVALGVDAARVDEGTEEYRLGADGQPIYS